MLKLVIVRIANHYAIRIFQKAADMSAAFELKDNDVLIIRVLKLPETVKIYYSCLKININYLLNDFNP